MRRQQAGAAGAFHGACFTLAADWSNPSNGNNAVAWDTIEYDTDGIASTGPPAGFTIPSGLAGVWISTFGGRLSSLGTNPRATIFFGGSYRLAAGSIVTSAYFTVTCQRKLAVGDILRSNLGKDSGTQTLVGADTFFPAYHEIAYLGTP